MKVTITKEEIKGIVANTIKQTMGMDVVVEFNAEGDVEFSTTLGLGSAPCSKPSDKAETKSEEKSVLTTITDKVSDIFN